MSELEVEQELKNVAKEKSYSLVLYMSHLGFAFPVKLLRREGQSFFFLYEGEQGCLESSLDQWAQVFRFTHAYRIQSLVLGEEKEPFSETAQLVDKATQDKGVYLELRCQA